MKGSRGNARTRAAFASGSNPFSNGVGSAHALGPTVSRERKNRAEVGAALPRLALTNDTDPPATPRAHERVRIALRFPQMTPLPRRSRKRVSTNASIASAAQHASISTNLNDADCVSRLVIHQQI